MQRITVTELKKRFGRNVAAARHARGWTQEQLAERVEVSVETIGHIERGIFGTQFELLANLSNELRQPVERLFVADLGELLEQETGRYV